MLIPKFIDPQLEAEMNDNGYVVIPNFLPKEDIDKLLALYRSNHEECEVGCWNSLYDLPVGKGEAISDQITAVARPHLAKLFMDWKFPMAHFIVKNPGQNHESFVHRDDSMHDETEVQYRQCWVPLVDLTEENGALYVVPKAHKLFTDERPMFAKWPYNHFRERLEKEFKTIYAKAGDLIVYFEKTLHGSPKNVSTETRPVFQGGLMHKDANPLFTRYVADRNEVEFYEVDTQFFANKEYLKPVIDPKYPLVKTKKYVTTEITESDLEQFFATQESAAVPA
jgi:ectoine hydroxylase-related dioxygenase (phytanoyl-CoA dioxygenase family)